MLDFNHRLYLVTDQHSCLGRDFFWVVEEAIKGGVDLIQLREKSLSEEHFLRKAEKLKELCDRYGVPLIINDHVQIAKATGAFALHVGQSDLSIADSQGILGYDFPIGLSVELPEHLLHPQVDQAWYLGISPVFSTPTKTDTISEWGLSGIASIRQQTNKPLVAIGNIKSTNAASVIASGADCIAVVSEICSAPYPAKAAELLRNEIERSI